MCAGVQVLGRQESDSLDINAQERRKRAALLCVHHSKLYRRWSPFTCVHANNACIYRKEGHWNLRTIKPKPVNYFLLKFLNGVDHTVLFHDHTVLLHESSWRRT